MERKMSDYREKTIHGDTLLPLSYYRCHVPESFSNLSFHWHEEMEITYIEKGSANYTINFETTAVEEGDLLFISPQILHGIDQRPGYSMISDSLVFHLNFLGCLIPDICTVNYLNPIQTGKYRFIPIIKPEYPGYIQLKQLVLKACHVFNEKKDYYELETKAILTELLFDMYQYDCIEKTDRDNRNLYTEEKIKEVLTYIQDHYEQNLSIRELASICHFSETYFMNFFRKYTGTTCVEYINRYRLSKAADALEETDLSVMDIAFEHGFRNVSYFNKLFKKRFGKTPLEYRKREIK